MKSKVKKENSFKYNCRYMNIQQKCFKKRKKLLIAYCALIETEVTTIVNLSKLY